MLKLSGSDTETFAWHQSEKSFLEMNPPPQKKDIRHKTQKIKKAKELFLSAAPTFNKSNG